jgi:sulfur carrier protein ThiS
VTEGRIRVKAIFKGEERALELDEGSSVEDMLRSLHLYIDAHIVTIHNHPVPSTYVLREGEELKIIQVASGG